MLAAPMMAAVMLVARNGRIMGRLTAPRPTLAAGRLATGVMLTGKRRLLRAVTGFVQ